MKHRYAATIVLTSLLFLAPLAHAATGFVNSPLLISPEAPKDGDTVTLSVLFENAEQSSITGTVEFYDGQTLLSKKSLTIDAGDVGIASTSFVIDPGIHKFSATMTNIDKPTSTGVEAVVISESTVTLPPSIVTKNLGLGAQASNDSSGSSESAILDKVNAAQTAVLNAVPAGAKAAVSNTATSLDGWRASAGDSFTADRDQQKASIDAGTQIDFSNAALKAGKKPQVKPATADNSLASKIKYYLFFFLAFFFSIPFAFYLGSVLILFFVIRFIFRRIRVARGRGKN